VRPEQFALELEKGLSQRVFHELKELAPHHAVVKSHFAFLLFLTLGAQKGLEVVDDDEVL
jgi:hypothetical protein